MEIQLSLDETFGKIHILWIGVYDKVINKRMVYVGQKQDLK